MWPHSILTVTAGAISTVGQGGPDSIDSSPEGGNELHRNLSGKSFVEISNLAGTDDHGYAQGVSHADLNQDGFADILIGNVGSLIILTNNGDGTFRNEKIACEHPYTWTSSVAAADFDGDPDS